MEALLQEHVVPCLPLRVDGAEWSDERTHLCLHGPNWLFNSDSAWRVIDHSGFVFGRDSGDAVRIVELVGTQLIQVGLQSSRLPLDPTLHFDNGWTLEVFSAQLFEPWVFRLPAMTLVAPIS